MIKGDGYMFIDMHGHCSTVIGPFRKGKHGLATPEQLIERYDNLDIERGILLPLVSPEGRYSLITNEDVLTIYERYPNRFVPFCNIDPRNMENTADSSLDFLLMYYKEKGCKGVGEITCNLPFNHPFVDNLFKHCENMDLPVLFHMSCMIGGSPGGGNQYGLYDDPGLPLLERALRKFPNLIFLGHSQAFWSEIASLETVGSRAYYPDGPVREEGTVVKLMRKYPNLHGELSATSGYNAISRDPKFGCEFLEEFQEKLYFGTDMVSPDFLAPLANFLIEMKKQKNISESCFQKISHDNACRLLNL